MDLVLIVGLLLFGAIGSCDAWSLHNQAFKYRRMATVRYASSSNENSDERNFFREPVQYLDLTAPINESSNNSRSLPLFLLDRAFFPQGVTYLNIFEMKYRTMMFDIANSDDMFGYVHSNPTTGQIASIGTMCKVIDRQLLEDGRQYIALQGIGRFRVNKILKTLPYIVGEVEPNFSDQPVADKVLAERLEKEVYNYLKYYLRLCKAYDSSRDYKVTESIRQLRPRGLNADCNDSRRSDFSFALANIIQMVDTQGSQLLLQTKDVVQRLMVERNIIRLGAEFIADQLIETKSLTEGLRDEIRVQAFTDEYDDDILPVQRNESNKETEKDEWDISNIN